MKPVTLPRDDLEELCAMDRQSPPRTGPEGLFMVASKLECDGLCGNVLSRGVKHAAIITTTTLSMRTHTL